MDVFLMIRRHKTTIFLDAKENNTVFELKKMIEGILKHKPEDQQLFKDEEMIDDNKSLSDVGFTSLTARAQCPAEIGLAIKVDGSFEELKKTEYSSPPELPDVMKPGQEASAPEQASAWTTASKKRRQQRMATADILTQNTFLLH